MLSCTDDTRSLARTLGRQMTLTATMTARLSTSHGTVCAQNSCHGHAKPPPLRAATIVSVTVVTSPTNTPITVASELYMPSLILSGTRRARGRSGWVGWSQKRQHAQLSTK